jgi:hypothetical protein
MKSDFAQSKKAISGDNYGILAPFLSAYDPSDLPGGSIDPLGFERGYLFLADKILPGLTNAAGRPRYLSVVCAGAFLAPPTMGNERDNIRVRAECVLRLERFWAAANVLASERNHNLSVSGIRGVTFAQNYVTRLSGQNARSTDATFKMLADQERYGVIGIYANVAGYIRLMDRAAMVPTRDLGERLGEAFVRETGMPAKLRSIIRDGDGGIGVDSLRDWGCAAHIAAPIGPIEGECIGEAFLRDPVRSRFAGLLRKALPLGDNEPELNRLRRMANAAARDLHNADLKEAIDAILIFEQCYRLALLGFERVLWLCKVEGAVTTKRVTQDPVVNQCRQAISDVARKLQTVLSKPSTEIFRRNLDRLKDVQEFFEKAAANATTCQGFIDAILDRHTDVQNGKFDRGRRKLPWIERKEGRYELTLSKVGDVSGEPKNIDDIRPHEYRLAAADRFIAAREGMST